MLSKVRSLSQRLRGGESANDDSTHANQAGGPQPLVPDGPEHFSGPSTAAAYANIPPKVNGVPIRTPRGVLPGTWDYPSRFERPGPPSTEKPSLSYKQWAHFRQEYLGSTVEPWKFPAFLDNPSCKWLQTLKGLYARRITFPASISPEGGLLLHSLVRNARPKVVVETGTFLGASALWIASALAENGDGGVLHCFDDFIPVRPGPWRVDEMKEGVLDFVTERIAEAGLTDHVVLHPGNSAFEIAASREELAAAGGVDFAYIDADHRVIGVSQDLWAVEPVLPTGGVVVLHDTFPSVCGDDGPRFLLDHVNEIAVGNYQCVDFALTPINYGMAMMRRIG